MSLKEFSNSSLETFKTSCAKAFGGFYEDSKLRVMSALHTTSVKTIPFLFASFVLLHKIQHSTLKTKFAESWFGPTLSHSRQKPRPKERKWPPKLAYLAVKQDLGLRVAELPEAWSHDHYLWGSIFGTEKSHQEITVTLNGREIHKTRDGYKLCSWFTLLCSRNWPNIITSLYSSKN